MEDHNEVGQAAPRGRRRVDATVEWAALAVQLERDQVHPVLWNETERLADSFICATCDAGWYEPDDPRPFQWVRPYWIVGRWSAALPPP